MSDTSEEKKHAPSASKLRKLRRDGSVPQTNEALFFAGRACVLMVLVAIGPMVVSIMMHSFGRFTDVFSLHVEDSAQLLVSDMQTAIFYLYAGILIFPSFFAIGVSILMNSGFVFSFKPLSPDVSKLDPAAGFKRIFGMRGWTETAAGLVRIVIWLVYALLVLILSMSDFFTHFHCGAECYWQEALRITILLIAPYILILLFITFIEIIIQRALFAQEQMMTDTEVKKESKENFGNPEQRQERKRLARENMETDQQFIKGFYVDYVLWHGETLIGISYEPPKQPLPRVVMRLTDPVAARKERALLKEEKIPFYLSKSLVKAMLRVPLGEPVPTHTFGEVAQALTAMDMR